PRASGGRGGEHDDVALRRLVRPELHRPVERDEIRADFLREQAPSALRGGEEDAPGRARELGEQALLRRDARNEVRGEPGSLERLGRGGTDGGDPPWPTAEPARDLGGAVRARDDQPVVTRGVDRSVAERLDANERAEDDLVTEHAQPLRERLGLRQRPSDDHAHAVPAASRRARTKKRSSRRAALPMVTEWPTSL